MWQIGHRSIHAPSQGGEGVCWSVTSILGVWYGFLDFMPHWLHSLETVGWGGEGRIGSIHILPSAFCCLHPLAWNPSLLLPHQCKDPSLCHVSCVAGGKLPIRKHPGSTPFRKVDCKPCGNLSLPTTEETASQEEEIIDSLPKLFGNQQ